MNRNLISKAFSDIDDTFIKEAMFPPVDCTAHAPERTTYMEHGKRFYTRRLIGLILAAALVFALAMTAYAADVGGIQRIIQIWRYGDQTTAVLDIQNGNYTVMGEDGTLVSCGGGVVMEPDGSERPLTEEEILTHLCAPDLWYYEDGTVCVYYRGQKIDITERFNADGVCYLELRDGDEVLYATITRETGMAVSPNAYIQPGEFGTE